MNSPDPDVRASAATAAGKLNHTQAVPALLSATQDQEQAVRDAASQALDRMGTAAVIAGLAALTSPGVQFGFPPVPEAIRTALPERPGRKCGNAQEPASRRQPAAQRPQRRGLAVRRRLANIRRQRPARGSRPRGGSPSHARTARLPPAVRLTPPPRDGGPALSSLAARRVPG